MKKGDWVFDNCELIGVVKHDPYTVSGRVHIDVTIYDRNGNPLGRVSPAMGGPKNFEPALEADEWVVIKRPTFPLSKYEYMTNLVKQLRAA